MKLVLYSGGNTNRNSRLHVRLGELAGGGRRKSITYIPNCSEHSDFFFELFKERYRPFGFRKFQKLSVDRPFEVAELERAFTSDVIYLAGGNTFYLLKSLQAKKLLPPLRGYAKRGGVLAGLSAGALVLTPNIRLAGIPKFDRDENDVGLSKLEALKVAPFEFFPHYQDLPKYRKALSEYSKKISSVLYAAEDGGGITVEADRIEFVGKVHPFYQGKALPVLRKKR